MSFKELSSMGTESRKVAVFMLVWVSLYVPFLVGKVTETGFIEFSKWCLLGLFAGLTAEHFSQKPKSA